MIGSTPISGTIIWGVRLMVRTPGFHPGNRGSIPLRPTKNLITHICGWVPEWPKGADCKSAGSAFEGSNPSPTTTYAAIAHLVEQLTCNQ